MMYEKGLGTQKDVKSAYAWYSKAAQNGDALARERMKRIGIQLKYH
jgi:TPR repeat protein